MQTQITNIGAFVGGMNTEMPQLADQIQYTTDELNCQLLPDGTRARRYGITREESSIGIPMTYTMKDWAADSAGYSKQLSENNTSNADTFRFDIAVNSWGEECSPVIFIKDGDSDSYKWVFEAEKNSTVITWYLKLIKDNTVIASNIFQTSEDPTGYTKFRIKVTPYATDTTQLLCTLYYIDNQDVEHINSTPALINPGTDFEFSNYINILGSSFTTDNNGSFSISNIKFTKEGEDSLISTDVSNQASFKIEYTKDGNYTIKITERNIYTITMVGAGSYEGKYQGSKGSFTAQGAAGAGIIFSCLLDEGEYQVSVGHFYGYKERKEEKHHGYFRTGGTTSIKRSGKINIETTGGSGQGFYPKNGVYEGPEQAYSGDVAISTTPEQFSIIKRSTNHMYQHQNSFLTGDTTGYGAINHGGYFKIVKGYDINNTAKIKDASINAYYWTNFNKAGKDCIIVQVGEFLRFYNAQRPYDNELITQINTISQIKNKDLFNKYQFSSGEGYLLCVSEYSEPFYITLDYNTKFAVMTPIQLQVRDMMGVNDYLSITERPTTLTNQHKYNLKNQGWEDSKITTYYNSQNVYPSNNLIWWYGKDANGDFNVSTLTKQYFGTTPAPRGHYVLNFFTMNRSSVSGVSGISNVVRDKYCVSSEFFAGRFFYLASSTVLFSQILKEDISGIGKCYQQADPTSQTISDLIATDGGEIIFQDLGYGKKIKKFPLGLLVFGTKTIYAITSTSSNTFNATQYLTQFVTNVGCMSGDSVICAEDVVYYWSPQGIYQIAVDTISGTQAIASSLSANTIQQWYNNLPNFAKENCVGAYDYTNRRIIWMYPTDENDLDNRNGVLVYYLDFKAFMPSMIEKGGQIITVFETIQPTYIVPSISLFAGDDEVEAGTNDVIVKDFGQEYGRNFSVCYLGYIESYDRLFFCDFYSRNFLDWQESMYKSFAISYPITFGSTWQKKYTPTLQCYFIRTEEDKIKDDIYLAPSSCYLNARWKWGETQESNRWDLTQEAYIRIPRFMEFRYVNGKIRVRGSGPAVQYKIESKEDNDFKLSGMNMLIRIA